MRKIFRKAVTYIALVTMLVIGVSLLCACQSVDEAESYFLNAEFEEGTYRCEYDSASDTTKVIFATTLYNNTIYDFNSFSVTLRLYNGSTPVKTETYDYNRGVKHGKEYTGSFNFYVVGEVDSIEYVSWSANYDSFWDTYKIWIIATIAASLVAVIIMRIADKDLSEIGWVFYDGIPILAILAFTTGAWAPVLIVGGGIIVFAVISKICEEM